MKRDYYEILQVDRSASASEIKAAYRKKALEFHPDRNPSHEAEEQFKEASEAYEVLSDDQKRQVYDQFGHAGLDSRGMHHGFGDMSDIFSSFSDIFEDFFGFGTSRRGRGRGQPGRDLRYDLEVSFIEAYRGVEKKIKVRRQESCEACHGQGYPPNIKPTVCPHCQGVGQVNQTRGFFTISSPCQACHGQGQVVSEHCSTCQGRGTTDTKSELKVKVPAGVESEMRLCLRGQGEAGRMGGEDGDLYVFLHVASHPRFHREGKDLILEERVSMTQAALGESIEVETPEASEKLKLPEGISSGEFLKLKGQGMPDVQTQKKGDLLVKIFVETPKKLNKKQKELLKEFHKLYR